MGDIDADVPHVSMAVSADTLMDSIRLCEQAIIQPPADVVAQLDHWDPAREAQVLRTLFADDTPVAGRQTFGARNQAWAALEDKMTVDALWDTLNIARAPSRTAVCTKEALMAAANHVDRGDGTVWAGDNASGWHGGASFTRWVRTEADADATVALFAPHCDSARVMPFLDGIPCSIHGIVFDDYVLALRPCEMMMFRVPGTGRFRYGQSATFWDPPTADRQVMRALAKTVGDHLRATHGYRGTFTVDGVLTRDGFLPTELNPRFGGALSVVARGVPDLPLYLLHLAISAGVDVDWRPEALEAVLLELADAHRSGGCVTLSAVRSEGERQVYLCEDGASWQACGAKESSVHVRSGPSAMGTFVRVTFDPKATPVGPPAGPRASSVLAFVDALWGLELGPMEAAAEVPPP
ncbi:MAG: hypothetical protein ACJA00_003664 [Myxococcota bacterium]|jgi:hypothetical protein